MTEVNISEKEREEIRKLFKAIEDIMNMPPEEKLKFLRRNNDLTTFL
jgi:CRISPR/Cas system-associated exonuclease Cas4 (RecB family)